ARGPNSLFNIAPTAARQRSEIITVIISTSPPPERQLHVERLRALDPRDDRGHRVGVLAAETQLPRWPRTARLRDAVDGHAPRVLERPLDPGFRLLWRGASPRGRRRRRRGLQPRLHEPPRDVAPSHRS